MQIKNLFLCVGALAAALVVLPGAAAEKGADHPLVGRFEGAEIIEYDQRAFDEYFLLIEKARHYGGKDKNKDAVRRLEGKITRITYEAANAASALEVFRAYEESLSGNGFKPIFACADAGCGGRNFNHAVVPYGGGFAENYKGQRYLAARKTRPEGDVYAMVYTVQNYSSGGATKNRIYTQVDVIEEQGRTRKVEVIPADKMAGALDTEGRVALYGLYFDTDKATIKPDSKPTLDEIGKLLEDNPKLKILVVGHTDNQGGFDYNIDLSKRRAAAVVKALTGDYGIAASRLKAWGVGYAAPTAGNSTEEGRTKNRRVELVAQ